MLQLRNRQFTLRVHRAKPTGVIRRHAKLLQTRVPLPPCDAIRNRVSRISAVAFPQSDTAVSNEDTSSGAYESADQQQFQWTNHWWPVAVVAALDQSKPHAVTLIGQDYVLWWDKTSTSWKLMQDRCPHRLAKLSLGRIDANGQLMCSWHGWTFDGKGNCTNIPQISDPQALSAACSSKRTCATAYPVMEAQGLLFAWLESGPEAEAEAASKKPILPEYPPGSPPVKWEYFIDQPMDFSKWLEQAMDPSHAPFLHSRLFPSELNTPMPAERVPRSSIDLNNGYEWRHGPYSTDFINMKAVRKLCPPNLIRVEYEDGPLKESWMYATPTRPGEHRVFSISRGFVGSPDSLKPNWLERKWTEWQYKNLAHGPLVSAALNVEDNLVNAVQDSDIQLKGLTTKDYSQFAPADQGPNAGYQWLEMAGYGQLWRQRLPEGASQLPPVVTPESPRLFSIYESHTKSCVPCQKAMKKLENIARAACYAAFALAILSLLCASTGLGWLPTLVSGVAAAACWVGHLRVLKFGHNMFVDCTSKWQTIGGLSLVPTVPSDTFSRFTP